MFENFRNGAIRRGAPELLACFLVVLALAAAGARAGWLPNGVPVCTAAGYQGSLVSAPDGLGGMLMVWQDQRSAELKIYARRIDGNGDLLWTANGVLVGADPSFHPWICGDGAGGAYIVWNDRGGGYGSILVQHLDASGSPVWAPAGVAIASGSGWSDNSLPVCCPDGLGGVIVAWAQEVNPPSGDFQVVAQRLSSAGTLRWGSQGAVVGDDIGSGEEIDIATDEPSNGALLGWRASNGAGVAQRVDLGGTPKWNGAYGHGLGLVTAGSRVRVADRKRSSQGAYVMYRWRGGLFDDNHLNVTSMDSTAYEFWGTDVAWTGTTDDVGDDFRVFDNGLNGVYAVWDRIAGGGGGNGIYAQNLDSSGDPIWGSARRVSDAEAGNHSPDAAVQYGYWGIFVTWVGDSAGVARLEYSIVERSTGGSSTDVLVPGGYSGTRPCIVAEYALGAKPLIAWMDERVGGGQTDIYATGLEANGAPTHPNLVATAFAPASPFGLAGGGWHSFYVTVKNLGTCGADSFWTTVFPDQTTPPSAGDSPGPGVQSVHCGPLDAGDSVIVDVLVQAPPSPETWSMWGFADYLGEIEEFGEEGDNVIGPMSYEWLMHPNLVIAEVLLSDADPYPGEYVTATVKVKNTGVSPAGPVWIDYWSHRATAPAAGDHGEERYSYLSLAPGDSVVWTTSAATSSTFTRWSSWFRVDTDDLVVEENEGDNLSGPHYVDWRIPMEDGWPVSGGAGFHSSPAIAHMDDDPMTLEVVIGCDDGYLYCWNHDGDPVDGWPVNVGDSLKSSPAVGDIAGDYRNEVVIGCDDGRIHAFDCRGATLWRFNAGWPVTTTPTLADLDDDGKLEVICGARGYLYVLEGDGSAYAGSWPLSIPGGTPTSTAVADVDNDGSLEIAVVSYGYKSPVHSKVHLLRENGASYGLAWPVTVDTVVVAGPVIGDLASLTSDLEIVAGGINGKVYAWNTAGVMWPAVTRVPGSIETAPALMQADKEANLEIAVTHRRYEYGGLPPMWRWVGGASIVDDLGGIKPGWPSGLGSWLVDVGAVAPPVVLGIAREVMAGSPYDRLYSYEASGAGAYGFPLDTGADIVTSAAAGDLDGDGWIEIVVAAGDGEVRCYELCSSDYGEASLFWSMLGHDRMRTHCYGFPDVPSGVGDEEGVPSVTCIRAIAPNPFNPAVRIEFEIRSRSPVRLDIYDVSGRRVRGLVDGTMDAGIYRVVWNGATDGGAVAASGVYFCRLVAGGTAEAKKMVLLR